VGHMLRSSVSLRVEASLDRASQFGLKTGRVTMAGGACGSIAEVALESSLRRTGRYTGLRRSLLSLLCRFHSIRP
jgi:hypothetical protein